MPIYEYQCTKCSHCFEKILAAGEKDPKIVCPKCGEAKPQRVISSFCCGPNREGDAAPAPSCGPKTGRFS